jgi:hypothetical protein
MSLPGLNPKFVEFIPEKLNDGILYVSRRYRTASHLCCCGCRLEVVTPLNSAKWHLIEYPGGKVSLVPSVGNWSFPCKSHYFVTENHIKWAGSLSPNQIAAIQHRDRSDAVRLSGSSRSLWTKFRDTLIRSWSDVIAAIKKVVGR